MRREKKGSRIFLYSMVKRVNEEKRKKKRITI